MAEKEPFKVAIPAPVLADLRARLKKTRWAEDFGNEHWAYGTNLETLKELVDYWHKGFNWRRQEREINRFSHYKTSIEGIPIHFIHEPGKGPRPIPLILSHGWPWTFWDLHKVIRPLSRPRRLRRLARRRLRRGGALPSRLRFLHPADHHRHQLLAHRRPLGPTDAGVLGYDKFAAQGGDWGALITAQLGHKYADRMIGIHVTMVGGLVVDRAATDPSPRITRPKRPDGASAPPTSSTRKAATSISKAPSRRPWRSRSTIRRRGCARGSWKSAAPGATATGRSSAGSPRTSC